MRTALAAAVLWLAGSNLVAQHDDSAAPTGWGAAPGMFPAGAQIALVSGDPIQPGRFSVLVSMPDGYKIPPHFHPTDEYVEVKQGTLLVGMGDKLDPKLTRALAPGDTATAAAGTHHYVVAQGKTIISITMLGPFVMTYVNPAQEPWRPFPYGY